MFCATPSALSRLSCLAPSLPGRAEAQASPRRHRRAHLLAILIGALLSACAAPHTGLGAAGIGDAYFPQLGNGGYDVQHYDVSLRVDPLANHLEAEARLSILATEDLARFNLDLWKLDVQSVEVDGHPAPFERDGLELIITPEQELSSGALFDVRVVYGGQPESVPTDAIPMKGGMGWMHHNDNVYVISQPNGTPSFVPCNDHPRDKATWSLTIEVPAPYVAVSNGEPEPMVEVDGWRTYAWGARDPMAPYLVTLAVAPFELEETWLGPDFVLRHYWLPEMAGTARAGLSRTADLLEFFSDRFGPYPFECYGAIVTDAPFPGALETQTIPIYGRGAASEQILAHEMAHQWFGDCVSVDGWEDIWLNEGFATYASWLWEGYAHGDEAWQRRLDGVERMVDSGRMGQPAEPGVGRMFSPGVYVRGAWVLYKLHEAVGDETFFAIMRTFVERFHNSNATTADFMALANEVSGADQSQLLNRWLYDKAP